ncbi:MAG: CopD family protein [Myxococcota bacterium]
MDTLVFRYLHFLGVAFWAGSAIAVAIAAATPTPSDSGVAVSLRKVMLRITAPAMLLAFAGGLAMFITNFALYKKAGWMHSKVTLAVLLAAATGVLSGRIRRWSDGQDIEPKSFARIGWFIGIVAALIVTFAVFKPLA